MFYLLTQILFICVACTALGAFLAYWYTRTRYEDVTETYDQLLRIDQSRGDRAGVSVEELDTLRHELSGQIARVGARVEAIDLPAPSDLQPVRTRLDEVADELLAEIRQRVSPTVDLDLLHTELRMLRERLGALEALPELREQLDRIEAQGQQGRKADLETVTSGVAALSSTITALRMPDLEPVHAHLRQLEERVARVELEPVHERLAKIEARLGDPQPVSVDLEAVHAHLRQLEERVAAPAPDLEPVRTQLASLTEVVAQGPRVDLGPVQERLARIEEGLGGESGDNDAPPDVSEHLARIEEHLGVLSAPTVDLAPVYERLAGLEALLATLREPKIDFAPVQARFTSLDARVNELGERLDAAGGSGDIDGLHARFVGLEGAIQALRPGRVDLTPLSDRLDALEGGLGELRTSVTTFEVPEPDLTAVIEQFDTMEGRLDLASIENRLTAIEYGLAAVHHTLRSRGETTVTRTTGVRVDRRTPSPAPTRVGPRLDPIDPMRRASGSNRLTDAAFGAPDDLTQLDGVGDPMRDLLHELGVYYFWQIAEWTDADLAALEPELRDFRGRLAEHDVVAQARTLRERPAAAARPGLGDSA